MIFSHFKPTDLIVRQITFLKNINLCLKDATWWRLVEMTKNPVFGIFRSLNKTPPCGV